MPGSDRSLLPWLIGACVVILTAVAAGLLTAYLVAMLRAVPVPQGAYATPTPPAATLSPSPTDTSPVGPTPSASAIPTASPTPAPTPSPTPLVHIVSAGEYLSLIADHYGVPVQSIIDLNELKRPDHIEPGQVLLIPIGESVGTPSP